MGNIVPSASAIPLADLQAAAAQTVLNGWTPAHIATSTTTLVKTGIGILHGVTVNSLGTVASSVTIYDGVTAAGTVLAVINTLSVLGSLTYDIQFTTGLTIVSTGTVAPDLTISYR